MTPQETAERAIQTMWNNDTAASWAGLRLGAMAPGKAQVEMELQPNHCNGHGTAHGGVLYILASSAFAMAINSYNERAVAQNGSISYLAPAHVGDHLTAQAVERNRTGRTGLFDVTVKRDDGTVIAEFRGVSRVIGGPVFED